MSRFYKKPIATLPPKQRSFRKRKTPGRPLLWLFGTAVFLLCAWWLFSVDVPQVKKLADGTIVEIEAGKRRASTQGGAGETAQPQNKSPGAKFSSKSGEPNSVKVAAATTGGAAAKPVLRPKPGESAAARALEKDFRPRLPRDVFEAQVALARDAICAGSIDGAWGAQTQAAVVAFQQKHGLRVTGQLDNNTRQALELQEPPLELYAVTPVDLLDLRPPAKTWLERAALDFLAFTSILEMVAERHWTNPKHIRRLNPRIEWNKITIGTELLVPKVSRGQPATRPGRIVIHLEAKTLELFDADFRLLAHFPCSIAKRVEKRPIGELEVVVTAPDPNYTFDPETFPESAEAQQIGRKLIIPPGPNNPVGVAWISLSIPSFGIHGSPEPEHIGRTESSGCFRLSNWNARYLLPLVYPGMPVAVEP